MKTFSTGAVATLLLLTVCPNRGLAQANKSHLSCSQSAFAAFKPLPKLEYECPDNGNDSDDRIIQLPARAAAIRRVGAALSAFTNAAWWRENVQDLEHCELHGKAGALSDEENEAWQRGDVWFKLFGNNQIRLVLLPDPCNQTGYHGSNAFLLYRQGARVVVTQVLNGYYSRVDNSVGFDFANLNGRQIIEIETANSMPPGIMNYYFEIDPASNKAVPGNLFSDGKKLRNYVSSDMLMGDPK